MKKPVIEFRDFGMRYASQQKPTLYDINLTIYEGEKVLILGPSGSGKSTLGSCLNGLLPFSVKAEFTGSLKVMGDETRSLDIHKLSNRVGTVMQDSDCQFAGLTVGEDVAFSLENDCVPRPVMLEKVRRALGIVGMERFTAHTPSPSRADRSRRSRSPASCTTTWESCSSTSRSPPSTRRRGSRRSS